VDERHKLEEESPPSKDAVVADVKACDFECWHLPAFVITRSTDTMRLMCPMGIDDYSRITSWNVSCTGVRSAKLRSILMNVFLMMRLSEARCRPES
jgi:hypothetical protein